jgi:hypothetical protein
MAAQSGVEQLYEQAAGPVFAYCYARVGNRHLAEWAVKATFDRAGAAFANGGIPEPELNWLLRSADKFCAPRLRLDGGAISGESVLVLQDWRGRSFDEIEAELTARQARLEEERSRLTPWRRLLGTLDLGPAMSWAKGLFAGASAVKVAAAAVAVVGAIAVVATPVATKLHDVVRPSDEKPAPAGGRGTTPSVQEGGTVPPSTPAPSGRATVPPGAAAGTVAGATGSDGLGSSAGASSATAPSSSASTASTGGHAGEGDQQTSSGGSAPGRPGAAGGATTASGSGTPAENHAGSPSAPAAKSPTVAAPTVSTPFVSTPTPPSTSDVTPTVPSVPETPTVPSVSTPSVPATPVTPDPPSVPSMGGTPDPPNVTTPSVNVPPPPTTPTVTLPTP